MAAARALCRAEGIQLEKFIVGDVHAALRALRQGFLDGLLGALGAQGEGHHLAAVLFLEPERLFEGESVGLVHLEADVRLADPGAALGHGQRGVLGRHLLDAHDNVHEHLPSVKILRCGSAILRRIQQPRCPQRLKAG